MASTQTDRLSRFNITCWLHRVRVMCSGCGLWQRWWEGGNAIDLVDMMEEHLKTCSGGRD